MQPSWMRVHNMEKIKFLDISPVKLDDSQKFILQIFTGERFLSKKTFELLSGNLSNENLREKYLKDWNDMVGICHDGRLIDDNLSFC